MNMNFKDLISTFCYNLISLLNHDITGYIIIILSLVYWALYKIIKEYSWNCFNKFEGFIFWMANRKTLLYLQSYIFFLWLNIFNILLKIIEYIYFILLEKLEYILVNKKTKYSVLFIKLYCYILGNSFIKWNLLINYN
jgi:hypothetical protein